MEMETAVQHLHMGRLQGEGQMHKWN